MNSATVRKQLAQQTVYPILFSICFAHLLNDLMQAVIPAMYPIIKKNYAFSFSQIGLITFTFQLTASLLQPFIGSFTDKHPKPFSFLIAMLFTLSGLSMLAFANSFYTILAAVAFVGMGSSIFHPEASRVAFFASGGKRGLAQSIFQLGGNMGTAIGPLLVALIVVGRSQHNILWFTLAAILGIVVLYQVGKWYQLYLRVQAKGKIKAKSSAPALEKRKLILVFTVLLILIFSKFFYSASLSNYYTFFLISKFNLSIKSSQLFLFLYLLSVAVGTLIGGPLGDKIGRKYIIWFSILGVAPFSLLLPHVNLFWTVTLSVIIGLIIASAFSAILVYATELIPGKVGTISGLFFGFAFGMAGIGSATLGYIADKTSIQYVFQLCAFLPLIGVFTWFLPEVEKESVRQAQ